jgi:hypothetical protein
VLLKLSGHISDCLKRARDAERHALKAVDPAVRRDHELMARSWHHLADSCQFVESLERFLSDSAHNKGAQPPALPTFVEEPSDLEEPPPPESKQIVRRRRVKQTVAFKDRLLRSAQDARAQAARLPAGPDRDRLLLKARQSETAANIDGWISSPPQHDSDPGKKR